MDRRSFLALLGAIPFVSALLPSEAKAVEPRKLSIAPLRPGRSVYAAAGERVTCENGHFICEFGETVFSGDLQDAARQMRNWQQPMPEVGAYPVPGCIHCGSAWYRGGVYRIEGAWRFAGDGVAIRSVEGQ